MSYIEDSADGSNTECNFSKLIISTGGTILFQVNDKINFPFFDIAFEDKNRRSHLAEIKLDRYDTENIAIEFEYKGRPSGYKTTKATLYLIEKSFYGKFYWIYYNDLKNYIDNKSPTIMPCNNGQTKCYLIPVSIFTECKPAS